MIKPNLLPLLMDQYPYKTDVVRVLESGERVIVDRQKSLQRLTMIFYGAINVGAFFQLAASYAERRVGFWLFFFFPTVMYLLLPLFMLFLNKRLVLDDRRGSVLTNSCRITKVTLGGILKGEDTRRNIWEYAKPQSMIERGHFYIQKKTNPDTMG